MKVSKELPQFKEKKALFIVSGEKEARFFIVYNGEIKEVDSIKIIPQYPDKEGHFERRGRGQFFGSGHVYEAKKEELRKEFSKKIEKAVKKISIKEKPDEIYLFSSEHMTNIIKRSLHPSIKKILKESFKGNYNDQHPFKLLEKIKEKGEKEIEERRVIPKRRAALKILEKFRRAKKFIKK
jgi:hypothetical protein